MEGEVLLRRLEETALVDTTGKGDELRLTDDFHVLLSEYRSKWRELDDDDLRTEFSTLVGDEDCAEVLFDTLNADREAISMYAVLEDSLPDLSTEDKAKFATLLVALSGEPPRTEGTPDAFLPVKGEALPALLNSYRIAVVYCWREDCKPCDVMKDAFNQIFETPPDDVGLFAVYGPDAAAFLHEEYNVEVAPTTLFVFDGEVDSRIIGSRFYSAIEAEIETLRGYL